MFFIPTEFVLSLVMQGEPNQTTNIKSAEYFEIVIIGARVA